MWRSPFILQFKLQNIQMKTKNKGSWQSSVFNRRGFPASCSEKQPLEVFCKKSVLKHFTNFKGKHLCWSWRKHLQACNFIKKRLWHRCFPINIAKFLEHLLSRTSTNDFFWPSDCFSLMLWYCFLNDLREYLRDTKYIGFADLVNKVHSRCLLLTR